MSQGAGVCVTFPSHHQPLVPFTGLPPDPALHPDLHPRWGGETHHPDSQEPAAAAVRAAQLRVHLPHPRQHHARHRPALQQHQHPVPEHLGECRTGPDSSFVWGLLIPALPQNLPMWLCGGLLSHGQVRGGFWCLRGVKWGPPSACRG